jgi:hypothetical protein
MMMLACEPQGPITGSYTFPTAVLGANPHTEAGATRVRALLNAFGEEHGLHRYRAAEDPSVADDMRHTPYNLRSTDYIPSPPYLREGIGLHLFEYSEDCWIISLLECSEAWTELSMRAFADLAARLAELPAVSSTLLVHPKSLQNAAAQRSRGNEDFEREQYKGVFCARIKAEG